MKFLDEAKIFVKSGNGGRGCLSFRREKYVEFGGPDGGDGGRGGDILVEAVPGLNTLIDFRYRQHFKARPGGHGRGKNMTGAAAQALVIRVPVGTQVLCDQRSEVLADLAEVGQRVRLAKGGDGGHGNAHFKTSTNRAPRRADPGWPGVERWLWLRLKLIADAGLIGLPNAGKSTLLAAVSHARPKIAEYPFTTLHPVLGVVETAGEELVLADIPGLIEGAHEGAGLGDRFLGHIERCGVLLHLVDGTSADLAGDYRKVRAELTAFGAGLAEKTEIVALNKIDVLDAGAIEAQANALAAAAGFEPGEIFPISGATGAGLPELLGALLARVQAQRAARDAARASTASATREAQPWEAST